MKVDCQMRMNINAIVTYFSNLFGYPWSMSFIEWLFMGIFIFVNSGFSAEACDWEQYLKYDFEYDDLTDFISLRNSKSASVTNTAFENAELSKEDIQ
jgi:hypothetical protein